MMTASRRSSVALVAAVIAVSATAACGSSSSGRPSESALVLSASARSQVIVTQLVVDTGFLSGEELGPGAVVNGLVVNNAQFTTWYGAGQNHLLSRDSRAAIYEEAPKVAVALRHLSQFQSADDRKHKIPPWTPEQTARAVLVQELVDAALLPKSVTQGFTDESGHISPNPALDAWYTAHQNDRLSGSSGLKLTDELAHVLTDINTPNP